MDFYVILGIGRDAPLVEIKRAYRRLARRFHPDINPGDQQAAHTFRQIAQAYEILSDPDRRRRYDTLGYQPEPDVPSIGFEGFDFSASVHANAQSTFGDLFADVLRRETVRAGGAPERGADLHAAMTVPFDVVLHGAERQLTVTRQARCFTCAGTGTLHGGESTCVHCQGTGVIRSARGHMVFARPCSRCHGAGVVRVERCTTCGGRGVHARTEVITVRLPAGMADATRLRLADQGHAGAFGGPVGDLYVTVHVEPHARFRRDGNDLVLQLPIAVHEAALGARIEVPALEGTARLRVPPGTQSGQRFRLRGRGVPSMRDGRRGDLVVEVRLMLPRLLDERSKQLLREFGQINGESVREL
jgi:molecular chaperone DnaJ